MKIYGQIFSRLFYAAAFILLAMNTGNASIFKIKPYLIHKDNGENLLRFELKSSMDLEVTISSPSQNLANQANNQIHLKHTDIAGLRTFNLGRQSCESEQTISFHKQEQRFSFLKLKKFPCGPDETVTIGLLADTQNSGTGNHSAMVPVINSFENQVDLIMNLGDHVARGGLVSNWLEYLNVASTYLNQVPLISVLGNHEYYYSFDSLFKPMPKEFYKYLRWNEDHAVGNLEYQLPNATLLILNSNFDKILPGNFKAQLHWLEERLELAKSIDKPVILAFHHAPFSSSFKHDPLAYILIRKHLMSIIEKYSQIKLILGGHQHLYERSVYHHKTYLTLGASGGSFGIPTGKNPEQVFIAPKLATYSLLKVAAEGLQVMTYNVKHELIDSFAITYQQ